MKARSLLLAAGCCILVGLAGLEAQKPAQKLLLLEWASKAAPEMPPVAVLIEMGLKDTEPKPWNGRVTAAGATIVHREGYRFRRGDELLDGNAWKASSHRPIRVPPKNPQVAKAEGIASVGIVVHLADVKDDSTLTVEANDSLKASVPVKGLLEAKTQAIWEGAAAVRRISTTTPVATGPTEDDFPAACYGPDGTLWVAYISYKLRDESRRIEAPQLKEQPADFKSFYKPEFSDQLFVKYYKDGKWSEPIAVTGANEDLARCAIAVEANGNVRIVYSAQRNGRFDLYGRIFQGIEPTLGQEVRLSSWPTQKKAIASFVAPVGCTNAQDRLFIAFQELLDDRTAQFGLLQARSRPNDTRRPDLGYMRSDQGLTLPPESGSGTIWSPAVTGSPSGELACVYDVYNNGDYDIGMMTYGPRNRGPHQWIVQTAKFEARPSAAYDPQGRLWIAYEEGPEKWGKDYGPLDPEDGYPLYNARHVRVVCLVDGKLHRPVADLPTSASKTHAPDERTVRYGYPKIGIDGKGRVWLTYRQKFGTRYSSHPGSYWLTFARRLDGDHWSEPIEIHHSDGLLDDRPALLPHAGGGMWVIHNTDGRYTTPDVIDNQIYASIVDLPGDPVEPKLVPHEAGTKDTKAYEQEAGVVKRIRDYRIDHAGKKYQLLRGEFHRHTELSWDGGPDGSVEDMFRYAIDAAAMDWIGIADHDNGAGREYAWWLSQKYTDAYHVPKAFTPLFCYERSVAYPHGHRNCLFVQRGVMTLPRLGNPDTVNRVPPVHDDDTKMFYRYLKEFDGICASHTSATGMGTDWRDNDPKVEPIVEIYQGCRNSYEYPDSPRAGHDPEGNVKPAAIGGWRPLGFINLAFQKGYRMGFQASSDHWSTHISYCVALAEEHSRKGILDALKVRHCYGATDDIIVDVRSGSHMMGDEFKTSAAPALQIKLVGTGPIARVVVVKDSQVADTLRAGQKEFETTWTDPKPSAGTHY